VIKLSDYVTQFLVDHGIKHVFMLTGGGCMHLVDSFGRQKGIEYICCLHEQAAAFAAQAYAEYVNGLGCALVTTGPGGTNAVTGVAAAWMDSSSTVFLSGQVKRADLLHGRGVRTMGPQEVDIVSVVKPITKYAVTILEPDDVRCELEKAIHLATTGRRGPVWLDIPLDVQAALVDETRLRGYTPEPVRGDRGEVLKAKVAEAVKLLSVSERPVLYLGNGSRNANMKGLVRNLAETLKIPVLISWKALDFLPEDYPFYAGRPGSVGQRGANFTQQNADCIVVIGARLDLPSIAFNHKNFARAATKVLVDVDPKEITKFDMPIDVPVEADAEAFIKVLISQAGALAGKDWSRWLRRSKEWQAKYPVVLKEYWDDSCGYVNTYVLIDVLADLATEDDLIAPGSSGPCSEIALQAHRVKGRQRLVNAPSLGAMGTGLPGAIGSCVASGGKRTICVIGDGGFQLNIQELETVHRLQLPIKYFILCNGAYASIVTTQRNYFEGRFVGSNPESHLTLPNVRLVAEAYGLLTEEIRDHKNIREKVKSILDRPGPMVVAVSISSGQTTQPRTTSAVRPDGVIVSAPMEDLAPLLPRDEFRANMIIPPLED
jgi:acetolactate synthase-1/2/3 large subunit